MSEALAKNMGDAESLVLAYVADPRPDLKDLIIVHYAPMVERIARRFSGIESVDDLAQVGYIGLLNALSKFDPEAGVRFNTYATHLVAGEIKHYLRDRTQTIRQPAWLQELRSKVNRATTELQAETGRAPSVREVAERIDVSESAVEEVLATADMLRVGSLDHTPDDEDGDSDLDRVECPREGATSVETRMLLEEAMEQLRDLEREVVVLFHFEALNQTEIANRLNISCNYVSHILRQSMNKLRRFMDDASSQERALRSDVPQEQGVLDPELGIYNEAYFRSRLTEEVHRALSYDGECAVITVEVQGLDHLRGFYGEATVREFLVDVSEFLRTCLRSLDVVCRHGKRGFGIVLPDTGASVAGVVERLQARADRWMISRVSGHGGVRLEFNYASAPQDARSVSDLHRLIFNPESRRAA